MVASAHGASTNSVPPSDCTGRDLSDACLRFGLTFGGSGRDVLVDGPFDENQSAC
jgi:hypothetical protein